jgi:hypothetical protein
LSAPLAFGIWLRGIHIVFVDTEQEYWGVTADFLQFFTRGGHGFFAAHHLQIDDYRDIGPVQDRPTPVLFYPLNSGFYCNPNSDEEYTYVPLLDCNWSYESRQGKFKLTRWRDLEVSLMPFAIRVEIKAVIDIVSDIIARWFAMESSSSSSSPLQVQDSDGFEVRVRPNNWALPMPASAAASVLSLKGGGPSSSLVLIDKARVNSVSINLYVTFDESKLGDNEAKFVGAKRVVVLYSNLFGDESGGNRGDLRATVSSKLVGTNPRLKAALMPLLGVAQYFAASFADTTPQVNVHFRFSSF